MCVLQMSDKEVIGVWVELVSDSYKMHSDVLVQHIKEVGLRTCCTSAAY